MSDYFDHLTALLEGYTLTKQILEHNLGLVPTTPTCAVVGTHTQVPTELKCTHVQKWSSWYSK